MSNISDGKEYSIPYATLTFSDDDHIYAYIPCIKKLIHAPNTLLLQEKLNGVIYKAINENKDFSFDTSDVTPKALPPRMNYPPLKGQVSTSTC